MAVTGLEVRLREGRERAEVARFTHTLDEIVRALVEIDQLYLLRSPRATWVLADLSHEVGDMVVRMEARPPAPGRDAADLLVPVSAFVDGAAQLAEVAEVPHLYMPRTVKRVGKIAGSSAGVQVVSVAVYNGEPGARVELTEVVRTNAQAAVRPRDTSYGSVSGLLALLGGGRREGQPLRVQIIDALSRRAVTGRVPQALESQLRDLWRHRVLAGGVVTRNERGQALRVEVDRLEALPDDDSGRPRTEQVLGVDRGWLGGRSVDEYLRAVRGA